MKLNVIHCCLIAFFGLVTTQAQSTNVDTEEMLIREKIEMYFEGWMTGDTTNIGKAMHPTCKLKNIENDAVVVYDRETYLGFFKPRARRENASARIVSINVAGNIAAAKCEIDMPKFLSTDYFNLMKVGGEWFIVDKIAAREAKE